MSGAIDFQSFVQGQAMTSDQQEQVRLATAALDTFTEAFNACDLALVDQVLSLHTNLWVVTCKQGRWAVALRSY